MSDTNPTHIDRRLHCPEALYRQIQALAVENGRSVNGEICHALKQYVGAATLSPDFCPACGAPESQCDPAVCLRVGGSD